MNKNIWIYWNNGFENSPLLVRKCLESWKYYNPGYTFNLIDDANVRDHLNFTPEISKIKKSTSIQSWSDVLRINLLTQNGGIWIDATVACNKPLDKWFNDYNQHGFFGFSDPSPELKLASWFLYAEKNNELLRAWKNKVDEYWKHPINKSNYFWFHRLFNQLIDLETYGEMWNKIPKFKANWSPEAKSSQNPHWFAPYHRNRLHKLNDIPLEAPLYKLAHGRSALLMKNETILGLFDYESK